MASIRISRLVLALASFATAFAVAAAAVAIASSSAPAQRDRSLAALLSPRHTVATRVIVLLRDQYASLPPSERRIGDRRITLRRAQAPLEAAVRRSGGSIRDSYDTVNAFAATVSTPEVVRLRRDPAVAEVIPDVTIRDPSPGTGGGGPVDSDQPLLKRQHDDARLSPKAYRKARAADHAQRVCPANPSRPIIAPQGRNLIRVSQAQALGVDGDGVTVGIVADGLDVDNPDFVRRNGSPVIVDYRDFSGNGTTTQSGGGEAFGDASTIAAQGNRSYDLSTFSNVTHPLPAGCDIRIKGVAPGASLVVMKAGGPVGLLTSTIVQALSWAVAVDHVNVLNESIGGESLPATAQNVITQFNRLATAAGVVVVAATGDQGTANTIGSPASDSAVGGGEISVGATTQFEGIAQTTRGAYQLFRDGWLNNNIASFSSAGFTQAGTTLDLVAPGNESFEPCTPDRTRFGSCVNLNGKPSNVALFGGTSESAPFTAGVAALVIQAYRRAHGGSTPSPRLVRAIILSNASDLRIPSDEQGAGELDALADVQAAESVGSHRRVGSGKLVSPGQLDFAQSPGTPERATVRVTNVGSKPETYRSRLRALSPSTLSDDAGTIKLTPATDRRFSDFLGVPQGYQVIHFTVPSGAQRLQATIAHPGGREVNLTLFDPADRMAAYTYESAGEPSGYGRVDVRLPRPGTWTAVVFTPVSGGFAGRLHYDIASSRFIDLGSVSPSSLRLAPGQSGVVHVSLPTPQRPGDYSRDLVIGDGSRASTVVPVVSRSLVRLNGGTGRFAGKFGGGNGHGFPAITETFAFDVPRGAPSLRVGLDLPTGSEPALGAALVAPDGQTLAQSQVPQPDRGQPQVLQTIARDPAPGRWRFVVMVVNPVGGKAVSVPFTGNVSLAPIPVEVSGIPRSARAVIAAGRSRTAAVTVTNLGNTDLHVFVDPRLRRQKLYALTPTAPPELALPLSAHTRLPAFRVPTETNLVLAAAQGSAPVRFDWGYMDPDLESAARGDVAWGSLAAKQVTPGVWSLIPALAGPIPAGGASATIRIGMAARSREFDRSVSSATGDPLRADVDPGPSRASPARVRPGSSIRITVRFTATGRPGSIESGDLFVDDDQAGGDSANELGAIPYGYRVGR